MANGPFNLLIDNNLSVLLAEVLEPYFPGTRHVSDINYAEASDSKIWELAKAEFTAILTKDRDFYYRVVMNGPPPKVIWITRGNCGNREMHSLMRAKIMEILTFLGSDQEVLLIQ